MDVRLFHDILRLRVDVFVVEQHCPYPELDGADVGATHVVGRNASGDVLAYARILPPARDGLPHVGRVVVDTSVRRHGIGRQLMLEVLRVIHRQYPGSPSALAAQAHLQGFYASLGYKASGKQYDLDGIPHIDMVRARSQL
ncbi:MAG: GNAT family N-acetyltransferase [Bacteroidetes bacterium]|nr:GNAT family N-acetyltransferase [Bacteroidota bacterium]